MPISSINFNPIYSKNVTTGKIFNEIFNPDDDIIIIYDDNLPSVSPPPIPTNTEEIDNWDPEEYLNNPNRRYHITVQDENCREIMEINTDSRNGGIPAYEKDGKKYIKVIRRRQDTDNDYVRTKIWYKDSPIKLNVTSETFNRLNKIAKDNYILTKKVIENEIKHDSVKIETLENIDSKPSLNIIDNYLGNNKNSILIDSKFPQKYYNKYGPIRTIYSSNYINENVLSKAVDIKPNDFYDIYTNRNKINTEINFLGTYLDDSNNYLKSEFKISTYGKISIGDIEEPEEILHIVGRSYKNNFEAKYGYFNHNKSSIKWTDELNYGSTISNTYLENKLGSLILDKDQFYQKENPNFELKDFLNIKKSLFFKNRNYKIGLDNNNENNIFIGSLDNIKIEDLNNDENFQNYLYTSIPVNSNLDIDTIIELGKNFYTSWFRTYINGISTITNALEGSIGYSKNKNNTDNDNILPYGALLTEAIITDNINKTEIKSNLIRTIIKTDSIKTPEGDDVVYFVDKENNFFKLNIFTGNKTQISVLNEKINDLTFLKNGNIFAITESDKKYIKELNYQNGSLNTTGFIEKNIIGLISDDINQLWGIGDKYIYKINIKDDSELNNIYENKVDIEIKYNLSKNVLPGLIYISSENKICFRCDDDYLYSYDLDNNNLNRYNEKINLGFTTESTLELIRNKIYIFTSNGKIGIINKETGSGSWRPTTFNLKNENDNGYISTTYWKWLPLNLISSNIINEKLILEGGIFVDGYISGGFRTVNLSPDGKLRWYKQGYSWKDYIKEQNENSDYNKSLFYSNISGVIENDNHYLDIEGNLRVSTIASKNTLRIDPYTDINYKGYHTSENIYVCQNCNYELKLLNNTDENISTCINCGSYNLELKEGESIADIKIGMSKNSPNTVTKWGRFDSKTLQEVTCLSISNKNDGISFWTNEPYIQSTNTETGSLLWNEDETPIWKTKNIPVTKLSSNEDGDVYITGNGILLTEYDKYENYWSKNKLSFKRKLFSSVKWFDDHIKWNLTDTGKSYIIKTYDKEGNEKTEEIEKPEINNKGIFYWWEGDHRWNFEIRKVTNEPGIIKELGWDKDDDYYKHLINNIDIGEKLASSINIKSPLTIHRQLKLSGNLGIYNDKETWSSFVPWYWFQYPTSLLRSENSILCWHILQFDINTYNSLPNETENRSNWYPDGDPKNINYKDCTGNIFRESNSTLHRFSYGDHVYTSWYTGTPTDPDNLIRQSRKKYREIMGDWFKDLYEENEIAAPNREAVRLTTRFPNDSIYGTSVDFSFWAAYKESLQTTAGSLSTNPSYHEAKLSFGIFSEKRYTYLDENIGTKYTSNYKENISRNLVPYFGMFSNHNLNLSVGGSDSITIPSWSPWKSFSKSWPYRPYGEYHKDIQEDFRDMHSYDPSCSSLLFTKEKYKYYLQDDDSFTDDANASINWFSSVRIPSLSAVRYGDINDFDPDDVRGPGEWVDKIEASQNYNRTVPLSNPIECNYENPKIIEWAVPEKKLIRNGAFSIAPQNHNFGTVTTNGESDIQYYCIRHATAEHHTVEITMSDNENFEIITNQNNNVQIINMYPCQNSKYGCPDPSEGRIVKLIKEKKLYTLEERRKTYENQINGGSPSFEEWDNQQGVIESEEYYYVDELDLKYINDQRKQKNYNAFDLEAIKMFNDLEINNINNISSTPKFELWKKFKEKIDNTYYQKADNSINQNGLTTGIYAFFGINNNDIIRKAKNNYWELPDFPIKYLQIGYQLGKDDLIVDMDDVHPRIWERSNLYPKSNTFIYLVDERDMNDPGIFELLDWIDYYEVIGKSQVKKTRPVKIKNNIHYTYFDDKEISSGQDIWSKPFWFAIKYVPKEIKNHTNTIKIKITTPYNIVETELTCFGIGIESLTNQGIPNPRRSNNYQEYEFGTNLKDFDIYEYLENNEDEKFNRYAFGKDTLFNRHVWVPNTTMYHKHYIPENHKYSKQILNMLYVEHKTGRLVLDPENLSKRVNIRDRIINKIEELKEKITRIENLKNSIENSINEIDFTNEKNDEFVYSSDLNQLIKLDPSSGLTKIIDKFKFIILPTKADFNFNNSLTVLFQDKSISGSLDIVSWEWDFGDGNTSTEQNPIHTYSTSGTYHVKLTVKTNDMSDSITKNLNISSDNVGLSSVTIDTKKLSFYLYDNKTSDSDTIAIYLNHKIIRSSLVLKKEKTKIELNLTDNINIIEIKALNEGTVSPNTASIEIEGVIEGENKQSWRLKTGESGFIILTVKES
jgi:PKD repeat protein